ncbi:hypothetical protein AAGV28_12075 [Flavobacterium sp. FZUC8N2.13]|uniref:Uncharacterized protein n=1 Tax=Flavobacterium zubiriense TaxID=3138075 RepID=A0ABV4TGJ5_9FLAO
MNYQTIKLLFPNLIINLGLDFRPWRSKNNLFLVPFPLESPETSGEVRQKKDTMFNVKHSVF